MPLPIVILVRTIGPRYPDDLGQVVGQTPQKFQLSGEAFFGLLRFDHGCLGGGALCQHDNPSLCSKNCSSWPTLSMPK